MSAKKLRKQHKRGFFEVVTPVVTPKWFVTGYGEPVPRIFKRISRSGMYEYIHVSISAERVFIS